MTCLPSCRAAVTSVSQATVGLAGADALGAPGADGGNGAAGALAEAAGDGAGAQAAVQSSIRPTSAGARRGLAQIARAMCIPPEGSQPQPILGRIARAQ